VNCESLHGQIVYTDSRFYLNDLNESRGPNCRENLRASAFSHRRPPQFSAATISSTAPHLARAGASRRTSRMVSANDFFLQTLAALPIAWGRGTDLAPAISASPFLLSFPRPARCAPPLFSKTFDRILSLFYLVLPKLPQLHSAIVKFTSGADFLDPPHFFERGF